MVDENSAAVSLTLAPSAPTKHMWHKADWGKLDTEAINAAARALEKFNSVTVDVLKQIKTALEIAKAIAALAAANPLETALREALKQIEDFIQGLLGNTGVHAIMIPIQKQFYGIGDPIPPDAVDPFAITPNYNKLVGAKAFRPGVLKTITPDTINFINTSPYAQGGNAGFYQTLVASTYDQNDFARPNFPENFAVTGVALVFGSASLRDIYRIIALLNRIIKLGPNTSLDSRAIPVAKGLTAKVCPIPTQNRIGVIVTWDPVPPVVLKPLFSGEVMVVTELILVRSTDPGFRQRMSWDQNFLSQPDADITELPSNATKTTKVIARMVNGSANWAVSATNAIGPVNTYIDADPELKIGKSYYYGLFLRTKIDGELQPVGPCSNVVWVNFNNRVQTSRKSQPPDWFASPSIIQIFPILQDLFSLLELLIHKYAARTVTNSGIVSMITEAIAMIERLIQEAEKYVALLNELTSLIRDLANAKVGGMYLTNFDVSTGGMTAWTTELSRRMSNKSDTSRPPFDNQELTAGFVIVAGAPNLPNLSAIKNLIELLFGVGETNVFKTVVDEFYPPDTPDDISGATSGGLMVFGPDMTVTEFTPVTDTTTGTTAPVVTVPSTSTTVTPTTITTTTTPVTRTPTTGRVQVPGKQPKVFDASMQPSTTLSDC